MKIIHTSDLHLDSPLTTRLDSAKVRERKSELLLSFRKIAEKAKSDGVEAFIIAGDLFDSEKVGKRTIKNLIDIINSCPDVTFFYLSGNHEKKVLSDAGLKIPENLKLFGDEWTYFTLGNVNFIGRCLTSPDMFSEIRLNENETNVIVLHGELRDHSDFGGVIGKKDAAELKVDYIALGHYHFYSEERINDRCVAVYSGTPEGRGFDEAGACGYVSLNAEGRFLSHKFIESAKRKLQITDVDVTGAGSDISLLYRIEDSVKGISRGDLVRIRLIGERELGHGFDTRALLSSLSNSFYYVEIKDETRLKIRAEDFKNDLSLKGEFIRGILEDSELSDKEKEAVINLGLEILMKEV